LPGREGAVDHNTPRFGGHPEYNGRAQRVHIQRCK